MHKDKGTDNNDTGLKKKKKKKKSSHERTTDLGNADPEQLTATERAKLKKLKLKKKKKHADKSAKVAGTVKEFHSTLQYPEDDEDEGLDDEVERPRNIFNSDSEAVDDDEDGNVEGALTGTDDEVEGLEHTGSIRTGSLATSSTQLSPASIDIPATTSNHKKAAASSKIPQVESNVNGLLPPLSVPASVINMLAQLAPKQKPQLQANTQSGGQVSTAFVASPAASAASATLPAPASSAHVATSLSAGAAVAPTSQTQVQQQQQASATSLSVTKTPGQSLGERMAAASFADLPPDERVAKLAASGLSNEQISLRTGLSLQQVMNARKKVATKSLIGDPRKLFADRLADFDEAFVEARRMYHDDPGSEIYYRAMNDFAKTMRELVKDYTDLEDPQEVALGIVNTSLRPFVLKVLKSVVDNMNAALRTVAPYLREQERVLLADNVRVGMKTLQDNVNVEYNKAVTGLEQLYNVDLTDVKAASSKPPEIEGSSTATKSTDTDRESKLNQA